MDEDIPIVQSNYSYDRNTLLGVWARLPKTGLDFRTRKIRRKRKSVKVKSQLRMFTGFELCGSSAGLAAENGPSHLKGYGGRLEALKDETTILLTLSLWVAPPKKSRSRYQLKIKICFGTSHPQMQKDLRRSENYCPLGRYCNNHMICRPFLSVRIFFIKQNISAMFSMSLVFVP